MPRKSIELVDGDENCLDSVEEPDAVDEAVRGPAVVREGGIVYDCHEYQTLR